MSALKTSIVILIVLAATPAMAQSDAEKIMREHTPDEINRAICSITDYAKCMEISVKDLALRSLDTPQQVVEAAKRSSCLAEKRNIPSWFIISDSLVNEEYLAKDIGSMRLAALWWVRAVKQCQ